MARLFETAAYLFAAFGQLALLWVFIGLYLLTMVPLAVIAGLFGRRREK